MKRLLDRLFKREEINGGHRCPTYLYRRSDAGLLVTRELLLTVLGVAQTKGSARGFVVAGKNGKPRAVITNDNPRAKGWQQAIADEAAVQLACDGRRGLVFIVGEGVAVDVTVYLPRPKAKLTAKWAGRAVPHVTRPDIDKLARVVLDALTGVVFYDDSQIVDVVARKRYCAAGEFPRVVIRVRDSAEVLSEEVARKDDSRIGAGSLF